jgi:hypothetical protein
MSLQRPRTAASRKQSSTGISLRPQSVDTSKINAIKQKPETVQVQDIGANNAIDFECKYYV